MPYGLQPLAPVRRRPLALIFPARQAATGRELFVKLLTSKGTAARRDFGREIGILRELAGCPGFAPLCVANLDRGPVFHACARVQGQSLIEIARAPSSLDVLLGYARELARWIADLHRLDIVHRDLSLGHVIVEPSGGLMVVDFGMAWRTRALPAAERRLCEGNDVQAVGLILWEMICQSAIFPYRGRGLAAVLQREAALVREAELPTEVRRLLMGCFAVQSEFTPEGMPPYRGFASATDALRAFDP